jgi:thiosulfate/3-mercaptopyruvate sulfurtransferase
VTDVPLDELVRRLGEVAVVDVRSPDEYDGSGGSACDPRQGHIRGAANLDVYRLMEMSPEEVRAALHLEPGAEVIVYCHSGQRSAIAARILRALGYDARNYPGSWHEWSRHEDLPVETGPASAT